MMKYDLLLMNLHKNSCRSSYNHNELIGLHSIAAFLNENGYQAKVYTGDTYIGKTLAIDEIVNNGCRMLGFYCDFDNVGDITSACKIIKAKYDIPIVVGGPQSGALGVEFLKKSRCDIIVHYEGELTMLELCNYFFDQAGSLYDIKGISFLDNNQYIVQPEQDLIENLDLLPFSDLSHAIKPHAQQLKTILSGRGCPFNCSFCYEGHHTKKVRFRSVENVLEEVRMSLNTDNGERYILFADDTFTLVTERVRLICSGIKSLMEKSRFKWFCEGHIKTLCQYPEMLDYLAEAQLYRMQIGIEAGNDIALAAYRKGCTKEDIKTIVVLCRDKGIKQVYSNIIVGGANFSQELFAEDMAFAKEILTIGAGVLELGVVTFWPLHGTSMTKEPEKYGLKIVDHSFYTYTGDFPMAETEELDVWEINNLARYLNEELKNHMLWMLKNNKVPHERILGWVKDFAEFEFIKGLWLAVMQEDKHIFNYYRTLANSGYIRSVDTKNRAELLSCHPYRVISLRFELISDSSGNSYIGDIYLNNFEREVLRYCSGKQTLAEIIDLLYGKLEHEYTCKSKFEKAIINTIEKMEKNYLMVYYVI